MTTTTKPATTTTVATPPAEASVTSVSATATATKYVVNSAGVVSEVPADWTGDPAEFKEASAAQIDAYKKPPAATPAPATTTTATKP